MSEHMEIIEPGYIYILRNDSYGSHTLKIGYTKNEPEIRAKQIYSGATGVPEPFVVCYVCKTADYKKAEEVIHERLKSFRINDKREFFRIPLMVCNKTVLGVCADINKGHGFDIENPIYIEKIKESNDDNEIEDPSIFEVALEQLILSDHGSILTENQISRIMIIMDILDGIYGNGVDYWLEGFTHDLHPENEIIIWEEISKTLVKADECYRFSEEEKKEAFYLLLARSSMSRRKVINSFNSKVFSARKIKEILNMYEILPKPLLVGYS